TNINELIDDEGEVAEHRKVPTDFSFSTAKTFDQINERMPPWSDAERKQRLINKNQSTNDDSIIHNVDSDNEQTESTANDRDSTHHTPTVVILKEDEKIHNGIDNIQNKTSPKSSLSKSKQKPISSSTGDQHTDLEHVQINFDKNHDKHSSNQKHSTNNTNGSTASGSGSGGFSIKNPVSSFRSWVSHKRSSKEEQIVNTNDRSITKYGKIDTSPTPRKSSVSSDTSKRTRTNSASATTTTSVINNNNNNNNNNQHQQQQQQPTQSNSSTATSTTRVKNKSSFALRNTNPIALLKRTPETNHNKTDLSSTEQTGAGGGGGGGGGGPFGYLKHLVRGDSSSSEKKQ
ncbi:unnamed protein product, partial [Rotaria magnacalcarata]